MGGLGSIGMLHTTQRTNFQQGIVVEGARNGVSVDADGYVVLGNDIGDDVGQLISDREIPLMGFSIDFTDVLAGSYLRLSGGNAPLTAMIDSKVTDAGGLDNGARWADIYADLPGFLDGILLHNEDEGESSYSQFRITTDGQFYETRLGVYNRFHGSYPNTGFLLTTNEIFNIGNEGPEQNTVFRWLCGGHIFQTIFQDRMTLSAPDGSTYPLFVTSDIPGSGGVQINFRAIVFPNDSNSAISFTSGGGIFYGSNNTGDLNIFNESGIDNGRIKVTGANVTQIIPKANGNTIGFEFLAADLTGPYQLLDVNINSGQMRVGGIGGSGHYVSFYANGAERGLIDVSGAAPFWNFKTPIQTSDPGSGVAKWMLGRVIADTVALDTTQYVEVNIGGAVVKLAVVT